jgi:hypothetical protein
MGKKPVAGMFGLFWLGLSLSGCTGSGDYSRSPGTKFNTPSTFQSSTKGTGTKTGDDTARTGTGTPATGGTGTPYNGNTTTSTGAGQSDPYSKASVTPAYGGGQTQRMDPQRMDSGVSNAGGYYNVTPPATDRNSMRPDVNNQSAAPTYGGPMTPAQVPPTPGSQRSVSESPRNVEDPGMRTPSAPPSARMDEGLDRQPSYLPPQQPKVSDETPRMVQPLNPPPPPAAPTAPTGTPLPGIGTGPSAMETPPSAIPTPADPPAPSSPSSMVVPPPNPRAGYPTINTQPTSPASLPANFRQ